MVRMFQHATLMLFFLYFVSLFFLIAWTRCPLTTDGQPGEGESSLFRPPFLDPPPCGGSSTVPKEGCLVTQSAAECCCCLRSTDKRLIQLSHLHGEFRLRLPVPSSTCCFRFFSIAVGPFLSVCAKCSEWTKLSHAPIPLFWMHQFHSFGYGSLHSG